jgi:branched-chain amino acid transport system permease protein
VWDFLDAVVRGIQTGAIYALVGLGLNIIFGATGVFNFAQGEMVMVGGLFGVALWVSHDVPLLLALLLVMVTCGAIGGATEIVAVRGTARSREATLWMLSTLGVAIIVQAVANLAATKDNAEAGTRAFPDYIHWKPFEIGQLLISPKRAVLVPIAIAVTFLVWFVFRRTLWGRGLSAMAFDREGAAMRGLPVGRLAVLAFVLGGAIAGFGGFVAGPVTQASVTIGFGLTLRAFVAATIGGIPELWGPLLGGIVLGLGEQFTVAYLDASLEKVVSLVLLLVVLLLRPHGLIGRQIRTL